MFIYKALYVGINEYAEIIKTPHDSHYFTSVQQVNGDQGSVFPDLIEKLILNINAVFHSISPYTFFRMLYVVNPGAVRQTVIFITNYV